MPLGPSLLEQEISMNTADLIERVAAEHDVAKDHARKIIDSALAAITAAAASGEEVRAGRLRPLQGRRPARTPGPQSRHRRAHHHRRVEEALLHTRQGPTRRAQSNTNEERHEGGLVSSRADRKTRRADSTGSAILTDRRGGLEDHR